MGSSQEAGTVVPQHVLLVNTSGTVISNLAAAPAGTATLSNVSSSASSQTLKVANTSRLGLVIVNDSSAVLYVKYGASASATSYTYRLASFETLVESQYTGIVDGIWDSATGAARVTELTA